MQWTWTWANFRRQWGTERPGMLQSMGLQRVRHGWATEKQQQCVNNNTQEAMLDIWITREGKGNVYTAQLIYKKEHKLRKDTQKCSSISTQHRSVNDIPSQSVEMSFLLLFTFIVVLIQLLSPVWVFLTHGLQHATLLCPPLSPRVCTNSGPLSQWFYLSHPLPPSSLFAFILFHQGLFQWVGSSHQLAKVLELQLQRQFFQWIFRVDLL